MSQILLKKLLGPDRRNPRRGMTFAETLVVVFLVTALMGGFIMVLLAGVESWRANTLKNDQQNELRKAVAWMVGDLTQSGASVVDVPTDGVWYSSLSFKKAVGVTNGSIDWSANSIRYQLSGTNPVLLQRVSGAQARIVALNIDILQFRRLAATPNVIEVNMRARRGDFVNKWQNLQTTLTFAIRMRNS